MTSDDQPQLATSAAAWIDSSDTEMYELRLYVAGHSPNCVRAVENLTEICQEYLAGRYTIEIVDLLERPQLARGDEIIAVPTLVRRLPAPIQRIIGDLSDRERLLVGLQLRPRAEHA